jgi:regulation of enolase protein 1 (concanavalin A-like superfamily)
MNPSKKSNPGRQLIGILIQTVEIGLIVGLSAAVFLLWQRLQVSTQQIAVIQATTSALEAEQLQLSNQPTLTPALPEASATEAPEQGPDLLSFSDPNDPASLNPLFGWQPGREGANSYDLTYEPGTLTLIAGAGTDLWQTNNSGPLIVLPVSGDFDVSVRVEADPVEIYQRAGIGVRSGQDANTWVNISHNYHGVIAGGEGIMVLGNQQGNSSLLNNISYTGDVSFFKIERRGPELSLFYSEDGTNWNLLQENYAANFVDPVEIFLMASSTSGQGLAARFSGLTLTSVP